MSMVCTQLDFKFNSKSEGIYLAISIGFIDGQEGNYPLIGITLKCLKTSLILLSRLILALNMYNLVSKTINT